MGWNVQLVDDDGRILEAPTRAKGTTYSVTGVPRAELGVSTNHYGTIKDATGWPDSLRSLHGQRAGDTIPELRAAVQLLGTEQSLDPWEETDGNAGHALSTLLDWAQQYPDATWEVL